MLKVYCLLTLCLTKWQLHCFITLTWFTNCMLQLKRSADESWPRCRFFSTWQWTCSEGHALNRLLYLNPDLNKCVIHHIFMTWHQVITICFQTWRNTSVDWDFWPLMSSSTRPKSSWRNSRNFSLLQALKNSEFTRPINLVFGLKIKHTACILAVWNPSCLLMSCRSSTSTSTYSRPEFESERWLCNFQSTRNVTTLVDISSSEGFLVLCLCMCVS